MHGFASQLGTVTGIGDVGSAHPIEVMPYAVTKNVSTTESGASYGRAQRLSVGGDLKFGLAPGVRLSATVNPDFGQVEADPAVLNLGAFETFFSEQRPFFVEGNGRYTFNINCNTVSCSSEGLFYSRRIGRTPQLLSLYGDASSATGYHHTRCGEGKRSHSARTLTRRARRVTQRASGTLDRTIEPTTNYGVVRLEQEFRGGEAASA